MINIISINSFEVPMASFMTRDYFNLKVKEGLYEKFHTTIKNIDIFYRLDQNRVHVFRGRQKHPHSFLFKNQNELMLSIDDNIYEHYQRQAKKDKIKEQDRLMAHENRERIQVGDVFATVWEFVDDIQDFYEVIEKPSCSYVIVRQLDSTGSKRYSSEPIKCKLNKDGQIVNVDTFNHIAIKVEND